MALVEHIKEISHCELWRILSILQMILERLLNVFQEYIVYWKLKPNTNLYSTFKPWFQWQKIRWLWDNWQVSQTVLLYPEAISVTLPCHFSSSTFPLGINLMKPSYCFALMLIIDIYEKVQITHTSFKDWWISGWSHTDQRDKVSKIYPC